MCALPPQGSAGDGSCDLSGHPRDVNSVRSRAASCRGILSSAVCSPAHPWKQGLAGVPAVLAGLGGIQVWIYWDAVIRESGGPKSAKKASPPPPLDQADQTESHRQNQHLERNFRKKLKSCCAVSSLPWVLPLQGSTCCSHTSQEHPAVLAATNPGIPRFQRCDLHTFTSARVGLVAAV